MRCYAQRQLNPFNGMLQVIEDAQARAFSANGVRWQLQVLAERPEHTWRSDAQHQQTEQFINWGQWSPADGLQQVPANPMLNLGLLHQRSETLLARLPELQSHVPFPAGDPVEYWACDVQNKPLALLASYRHPMPEDTMPKQWRASSEQDKTFVSEALLQAGIDTEQISHARYLEAVIHELAPQRCWLQANNNGYENLDTGEQLPAANRPPLGIYEAWEDPLCQAAFADYIAWQSPLLLTLQGLGERRRELEQQAAQRATLVDTLHRLYPRYANPALIEQIRVQARLANAD